jgi:hypothetical protein
MRTKSIAWTVIVAVTLLAIFALSFGAPSSQAAPLAAPTPVAITPKNAAPEFPVFFNAKALTADTRSSCFEVPDYAAIDLMTIIDQGTTNTVTLKLQHSNDNINFADGLTAVAANEADATAMQQFLIYGRWTCIYADVINTNTVTVTVQGVVK